MAELLLPHATRNPQGRALADDYGETTWAEFQDRTNRLIHVLRAAGIVPGDRVAVHSGNRREVYEIAMACLHAGFSVVQTNWNYKADELAFVLTDSDARVLIVDDQYADVADEAVRSAKDVMMMLGLRSGGHSNGTFSTYERALASAPSDEPENQVGGAAMFYTSGTTGRPKGVLPAGLRPGLPMRELIPIAQGVRQGLGYPQDGQTLLIGPVYHSGQWAMTVYPLLTGIPLVMTRFPEPSKILEIIDAERVTHGVFNPVDFVRMLKLPAEQREKFDGSSLVQVIHGGAPCAPDVKRQMIDWWGPILTEYYGASEGGLFALASSEDFQKKVGSVGRILPFIECRIVTDDGRTAEPGEAGLIYVRHRSGADFAYHKQPEKTAEAHLEPGLFTLGDVGYLDEDGYLYLSDRKSEVINSGSVKIYPAEIEGLLAGHPKVLDVAVLGVPNDELGEEVKAAVKLSPGYVGSDEVEAELIEYAAKSLAPYKVPKSVDFFDELPRTDAGKLAKASLRERYWVGTGRKI
jgi:long-chain acyl-CoA synthetase